MPTRDKSYGLERSPLYRLHSRSRLAGLLFVSRKELKRLSGDVHLYRHFHVKKKDKSLRPVEEPRRELKAVQRASVKTRGKICPTCGGRFDGAAVFCGKDGTALVLLN